ncbi:MAG: cellulase family glycosylhydrolase [Acidobacteria bacterium]|nr:cellulase family glycosylhydrolase [Acidobacteriota bacterium]
MRKFTLISILAFAAAVSAQPFITVRGGQMYSGNTPYHFVGANYWYGSYLGLERDKGRGIERLRRELDLMKANGVTNLRLIAGAEGSGLLNGIVRIGPPLQPRQLEFDGAALVGIDVILDEMSKRGMRAVIFFSNNWEWSGGWQQYLIWNNAISSKWLAQRPEWDELRDLTAKFYDCDKCIAAYRKQVAYVLSRRNSVNGRRYVDDPTIMAWEIANEPRPMRPASNDAYVRFIAAAAKFIRRKDSRHLITTGHEGYIGTESVELFEKIHSDANIDYLTVHIWPKNWGWFEKDKLADGFAHSLAETEKYIAENAAVAVRLNKPLVIEEFGLPRDGGSIDPHSATTFRDRYYAAVFAHIGRNNIAGAAFWAFGGYAVPSAEHPFWQKGDELTGDPPMEEQGLNSVFAGDTSTLNVIRTAAERLQK